VSWFGSPAGRGVLAGPQHRAGSPASRQPRLYGLAAGALTARAGFAVLAAVDPPAWQRLNYRDAAVTLAAGPALVAGTLLGAAAARPARSAPILRALVLAVGPAALAGGYDDACGSSADRGLRGHFGALRSGIVTTGVAKIVGIGVGAVLGAYQLGGSWYDITVAAGLIAGTANALNLLDLRPGRAAKAALLLGAPLLAGPAGWPASGAVGAAAGLLPVDLGERGMLGDTGANALGAALGVTLAATAGRRARTPLLAAVGALTMASERVSFTTVIDATPPLRWFDRLGRIG
jgi:UDP-N-acetylmuramyl pentapeptide phosphotransferase/UDP-N-acetylglucosamine-1-phosphate transferase